MKKAWYILLQITSIFLFIALFSGLYQTVKKITGSKEGLEFNLGYALGAIVAFGLFFWLALKLFRYSNKKLK